MNDIVENVMRSLTRSYTPGQLSEAELLAEIAKIPT